MRPILKRRNIFSDILLNIFVKFIIILIGGSSVCTTANSKGAQRDKYCGSKLNTDIANGMSHIPICGKLNMKVIQAEF